MNTREKMISSFLGNIEGWKSVLNSSPDLIAILDTEFNVVWVNKAMARILNNSHDSCLSLKCFEAVHSTQSPIPNCPHAKMVLDGQEYTEEVNEDNWGGCFSVTASPIKDDSGNVLGSIHIARDISEHKKAEEKIQRLADVVESSDDVIVTKSLDGTVLSWNKGAEQIYGYSAEEILGAHISILEPFDFSQETEKLINKIKSGEKIDHYETLRLRKDGKIINVSITLSPVFDTSGELVAISTIARDVTERKRAEKQKQILLEQLQQLNEELEVSNEELQVINEELHATNEELHVSNEELQSTTEELHVSNEELQNTTEELQVANEELLQQSEDLAYLNHELSESEQRMNRSQEIGHIGSWELDIVNDHLFWSDEVYRIFGMQPQEFSATYDAFLEAIHPDDRKTVDAAYSSSLSEGRDTYEIEHRVVRKSTGEVRIVHEKCEHIKDDSGQIIRSVGLVHDITERKQAEKVLKTTLQRFYNILSSMRTCILLVTDDDLVEFANPAFCDYFDLEEQPEDLVGLTAFEMIKKIKNTYQHPDKAVSRVRELVEGWQPLIGEEVSMQGGKTCLRNFIPISIQGEPYGRLWVHIDITERKRLEMEQHQLGQQRQLALDAANMGWWHYDPATEITTYDEQYKEIFGVSGSQRPNEEILKLLHPDDLPHVRAKVEAALDPANPKQYSAEYRIFHNDGSVRWIEAHGIATFEGEGDSRRATSLVGTVNDITERKEAVKVILWNQKRNELLTEVSSRLLSSENPQDIIDDLCQKTMEFLECDVFFNYLVDEQKGRLHLNAYAGISEEEARNIKWIDYGAAVCGCAALESRRIIAENILGTEDPRTDLVKSYGVQAYACHPLMIKGLSIGTLSFGTNSRTKFTDGELELMKAVADQISIAMNWLISNRILKESEEAAVRARNEWEQTFEAVPDLIAILDTDYKVVRANKAMANRFGITPEECTGLTCYEVVHGMDTPPSFCPHKQLLADGSEHTEEVHEDNLGGDFLVSASPLHDSDGKLIGSVHVARDINERKKKEKELYQINRAYRALSNSSQAMIRAKTELEYLEEVCRIIIEDCGHSMVWIGYAVEDEGKTVRPVAYSGFEEGYLETLDITWEDTERGHGPTGTAIRTGKPSFCKNMLTDPKFKPWREEAVKRGYASSVVLPLMTSNKAFGALSIYSREPDPFSEAEVKLLTELAEDLAYGINAIRLRIALEQSESALREAKDNLEDQVKERTAELEEAYRDLKMSEEQLKRQAELLSLTHEAIIVRDMDGKILFWNDGAVGTYGWSIKEAKGKVTHQLLKTIFPDPFEDILIHLIDSGQWDGELIHTKRDGTQITVLSRWALKRDKNGNPSSILEINSDISERKKMEEELEFAGKYNRSLIETSLDPLVTIGPDGKITDVNGATEAVTGYSRDEIIGTDFSDYFTQPHKAREGYILAFREGWVLDYPLEIQHRDGHVTPVLYNASVYEDESGNVRGVFAAARDVTELKRAEAEKQKSLEQTQRFAEELEGINEELQATTEELQVSNEELQAATNELQVVNKDLEFASKYNRSLIETSLDPLVTIGPDGKITDVNQSTEAVTGYYRNELIGTDFLNYFTEPEKAREGYLKVFKENYVRDYPLEIQHKMGHITPVLYNASVYRDDSGNVIGVFAAARDITERRKAEKLLKLKLEELARSNAELEQFAYVSSHDLQEPLRMIGSYLQLLQRRYHGELDDKADKYINFAVDGATRMQNLINDLLEFSRVTTRAREFEPTDCEVVLGHVLSNLEVSIKENEAIISHDHLPTVMADSTQLIQIFQNLISNAIKFRSEETPKIYISAQKEDDHWIFSVADNGIGIEPKHSERIFEVFKRLHKRREYPGTGIGLSICKKIIERHGGHIWVESEQDKGSVFYFTLEDDDIKME